MLNNINNYLYVNLLYLWDFWLFVFYLIILLIILLLILTDNRFSFSRKIIFIIINILFLIISLIINESPLLIIKDLFWYSLLINFSFIFHVLILNRIFYWAWKKRRIENEKIKKRYEYIGFIVSRISFTLSIWGIMYFLQNLMEIIYNKKYIKYYEFILIK